MSIKMFATAAVFAAVSVFAADAKPAANAEAAKPADEKLIQLANVEQSFAKALNSRNTLINYIITESAKIEKASDADKKTIQDNLAKARQSLAIYNLYMDTVFGIGNRRDYEYDKVKSTIYLKVGTPQDAFARTVNRKAAITAKIAELDEAIKAEKDEAKLNALKNQKEAYSRAYTILENALFAIFQIHPKRQYTYEPKSGSIYLKSNAEEIQKLQEEINKNKAAAEAAKKVPADIK